MNYFRSEWYRVTHTHSFYLMGTVWLTAFAFLTYAYVFSPLVELTRENYQNGMFMIIAVASFFLVLVINNLLTGKRLDQLKQSLSFGVSRRKIYGVKLLLTLLILLLISGITGLASFFFGEYLLLGQGGVDLGFPQKILSLLPLVISCGALCNWLNFNKVNPVISTMTVLFFYLSSGDLVKFLDQIFFKKVVFSSFMPSTLLEKLMLSNQFQTTAFLVGTGLTVVFLFCGSNSFQRRDVA